MITIELQDWHIGGLYNSVDRAGGRMSKSGGKKQQQIVATFTAPGHDHNTTSVCIRHNELRLSTDRPFDDPFYGLDVVLPFDPEFFTLDKWNIDKGVVRLFITFGIPEKYTTVVKVPHTPIEDIKGVY